MDEDQQLFIGIDPGAVAGRTRRSFTFAALDTERRLSAMGSGELSDILAFISNLSRAIVAINGPTHLNCGLQFQQPNLLEDIPQKTARLRQVEFELRARGLHIPLTPASIEDCPHWMNACLHLYQNLRNNGFAVFPSADTEHQVLETQTEASFSAWMGNTIPLPAGTLEGRLQRQLALFEQRLPVSDPMDFFEEITRYKLLHGILPANKLHTPLELNALAAAAIAWQAAHHPDTLRASGDLAEGVIYF